MKRGVRIGIFTVLAIAGTAFLLFGIFSGQAESVLKKAIRICMECIGIG
ncbi:MAG: hypothetical protein II117_00290 [Clostridia bacterium]|nr:hypothetical protein [Clostridia bacterium]